MKQNFKLIIGATSCLLLSSIVFAQTNNEQVFPTFISNSISQAGGKNIVVNFTKSFPGQALKEIGIETSNADVELKVSESNQVMVSFKGQYKNSSSAATLKTSLDGDKLLLKTEASDGQNNSLFGSVHKKGESKMIIEIPKNITKVSLKAISGDIKSEKVSLDNLQVETISGNVDWENAILNSVEFKTVSGNLEAEGQVKQFNAKTVSGDVSLKLENTDPVIRTSSSSGDVMIAFKKQPDISINFSSVSGAVKINKDFGIVTPEGNKAFIKLGSGKDQCRYNPFQVILKSRKVNECRLG